jgi:succinyl-CoA synthetase alpha subunit
MRFLLNQKTPIVCQSSLKAMDLTWIQQSLDYGTNIVGITSFIKHSPFDIPVPYFDNVQQAVTETGASVSVISVPSPFCQAAILEALEANIKLIICLTRHLPIHDMLKIKWLLKSFNSRLLGPNSTGIIAPENYKIGAIPHKLYLKGNVGIISRSNTLMHEMAAHLTDSNIGQSICVSIGSMTMIGAELLDLIKLFEKDENTNQILIIDKIDTPLEKNLVHYLKQPRKKPIAYYLAGTRMMSQSKALRRYLHRDVYHQIKEKLAFFTQNNISLVTSPTDVITRLSCESLSLLT